ncbi:MAG TPA: cytidine deaminase [Afifellaceae bacterium]|nr:cytidine deaminase [Afifellaceae bacterium]
MADDLFNAARAVMANAHAPYSTFPVGAALRTESGAVYVGCNVENASYPEGWCAETGAIAAMVAAGETAIVEIAIVAGQMPLITPCGGCRQRLAEFAGPGARVHLCDGTGIARTVTLGELLPRGFAMKADR